MPWEPVYTITSVRRYRPGGSYDEYVIRRGWRKLAVVSCALGRVRRWYDKRGRVDMVEHKTPSASDAGHSGSPAMTIGYVIVREAFGEKMAWRMAGRSMFEARVMGMSDPGSWKNDVRTLTHAELFAYITESQVEWAS